MQVFSSLLDIKNLNLQGKNFAVALGTFDGVHIGHQNVIMQAVKLAKENQGLSAVFTFSNHPLSVIAPKRKPLIINDTLAKIRDIEALGVDFLFNIEFNLELCQMEPEAFVKMLKDYLSPKFLVTGPNYSFGVKGLGTPDLLKELGEKYGFKAYMQHFIYCHNNMVSSTVIRKALAEGDLDCANKMLGKPFSIDEEVIHGKKRGRLLGSNPTFEDISRRVEVNIFDFQQTIYGQIIRVDFLKMLRREIKFTSVDALLNQMKKDVKQAKAYFVKE